MKTKTTLLLIGLQVIVLAAVIADLWVTTHPREELPPAPKPSLPCAAVPMSFISENPECADHLLRAMNVTGVHIRRLNESALVRVNRSERMLAIRNNVSREAAEGPMTR